jgi:hypothetical protein
MRAIIFDLVVTAIGIGALILASNFMPPLTFCPPSAADFEFQILGKTSFSRMVCSSIEN